VRRLHDTGRSGGYIFLGLLPIIGWIWLLILLLKKGDDSINKYGIPSSSSNSSTNSKHEEVLIRDFKTKSNTENKVPSKPKNLTNTTEEEFNPNKESLVKQLDEVNTSNDDTQSTEEERIERQYIKGIFTTAERDRLIANINLKKRTNHLKDIEGKYLDIKIHEYNNDCKELNELHLNGHIDKTMLNDKLKYLKNQLESNKDKIKMKAMLEYTKSLSN
jgi:hypothetical protein